MRTSNLLLITLSAISLMTPVKTEDLPGYKCIKFLTENDEYYNLKELKVNGYQPYSIKDVAMKLDDGETYDGELIFNVCGVVKTKLEVCDQLLNSTAYFVYNDQQNCVALSTNSQQEGNNTVWTYGPYNKKLTPDGFSFIGNNSRVEDKDVFSGAVKIKLLCNENAKIPKDFFSGQEEEFFSFGFASKYACGRNTFGPFSDLVNMKWPLAVVAIVFGFALMLVGYKIFKPALTIVGFLLTFMMVYAVFDLAFEKMDPDYKLYITLGFALILAGILAYFIYSLEKTALVVGGMFLGGILGLVLYVSLDIFQEQTNGKNFVLWVMVIAGAGIFGFISFFMRSYILAVATSYGGAYLIFRSIGGLAGNYPDEFELAKKAQAGEVVELQTIFWVYIVSMGIFGTAGLFYQCKNLTKEGKKNEDEESEDDYGKIDEDDFNYDKKLRKKNYKNDMIVRKKKGNDIDREFNDFFEA